jgi:poly(3-hydroxybutyrate) depolymerase
MSTDSLLPSRAYFFGLLLSCLLTSASALAQSATCVPTGDPEIVECTGIVMGLLNRSYNLFVPANKLGSSEPLPLVLDFHGSGSSKETQSKTSCWRELATDKGVIVAYPNGSGIPNSFSAGTCCGIPPLGGRNDIDFAERIVHDVRTRRAIDPNRIYVTGWSNGGKMAHHLACEPRQLYAGIASMSQSYSLTQAQTCLTPSERRIPIIDFRATGDHIVPYGFSTSFSLSAAESMERWGNQLECDRAGDGSLLFSEYQAIGPEHAVCQRYQGCDAALVQCTLTGDHNVYANWDDMQVCETAWKFWQENPVGAAR